MTDAARQPAEVFPLSAFLVEEMQARGWTTDDLASRMTEPGQFGVTCLVAGMLVSITDDKMLVHDDDFARLARAFDVDEAFLRRLDAVWRSAPSDRRAEAADVPDAIYGRVTRMLIDKASVAIPDPRPSARDVEGGPELG